MQFHSWGERTGEQEDTARLDSPCLALLATEQLRADQSIAQMVNTTMGGCVCYNLCCVKYVRGAHQAIDSWLQEPLLVVDKN